MDPCAGVTHAMAMPGSVPGTGCSRRLAGPDEDGGSAAQTVTDALKQGAACIGALAADQLDAAELTAKAQQYLKLLDVRSGSSSTRAGVSALTTRVFDSVGGGGGRTSRASCSGRSAPLRPRRHPCRTR